MDSTVSGEKSYFFLGKIHQDDHHWLAQKQPALPLYSTNITSNYKIICLFHDINCNKNLLWYWQPFKQPTQWRHQMETFPRYWPFVWVIHWSLVNSSHKGQWCGALMFSLICAWTNGQVNNRDAGDLRRHWAHYDVIVINHLTILSPYYHECLQFYSLLTNKATHKQPCISVCCNDTRIQVRGHYSQRKIISLLIWLGMSSLKI